MTQQDNSNQCKPIFGKANMLLTMQYLGRRSSILTDIDAIVCDPFVGLLDRHTLVNEYEPYAYRMMSVSYDLPECYELEKDI
ncbi:MULTISPECIES: hypothetical protein [Photorhabdus]|uniref:Uncharacterized protein n=2 Tax=Photorhabdus TaxID=29487 RepID=A0AAW6BPG5_9GAMM|nr:MULTISPECIES: hypothetical protein [Photorhabdus]EYU13287.1 hypothetical protein BA1DRAFT_04251 [Photorhabdus aegyptia]MDB6374656.1 hypothetical protein [Photorhabdus bodei]